MTTETVSAVSTVTAAVGSGVSSGIASELLASFAGAAFAFGFFLVGQTLVRAYERRKTHYNALVALEHVLNLQLDQANLIRQKVPEMADPIRCGQVYVALPRPILETDDSLMGLLDLELINSLLGHRISVDRLNADILNIHDAYQGLKDRYLDGSVDRATYISTSEFLIGKYSELADALLRFESEVVDILTHIRMRLAESRPPSFRVVSRLSSLRLRPLPKDEFGRERAKLLAECEAAHNPLKPE